MEVSLNTKINPTTIKISISENDYHQSVQKKVKQYASKANIKGFRKGKVPTTLIKKMYGQSILVEEVNQLVSNSINDYIKEKKLRLIGEPILNEEIAKNIDWSNQANFEFEYQIGLVDSFDYDLSEKIKLKSYQVVSDKKTLDETMLSLREQFGDTSNPEISQKDDIFVGELKDSQDNLIKSSMFKWRMLSKKQHTKFVGLKVGDEIMIEPKKMFVEDDMFQQVFGLDNNQKKNKNENLSFELKELRRVRLAEFNQEFYDKVFGKDAVSNYEAFQEKVTKTIEDNYNRNSNAFLLKEIHDLIIKNTKINLPELFIKNILEKRFKEKKSEDTSEFEKEYNSYLEYAKWDMISNKIMEDNQFTIENKEVFEKAKSVIFSQFGGNFNPKMLGDQFDSIVENYLKSDDGANYARIYNEIKDNKVLEFAKSKITLSVKKISPEEFTRIVSK